MEKLIMQGVCAAFSMAIVALIMAIVVSVIEPSSTTDTAGMVSMLLVGSITFFVSRKYL